MRRFGRRPMAALELLAGAAWAKVIAASNGYLVDRLSRIADGFSTWSTASKPVRMNVAHTGGDHVNEGLMSNQSGRASISDCQPRGSSAMPLTYPQHHSSTIDTIRPLILRSKKSGS